MSRRHYVHYARVYFSNVKKNLVFQYPIARRYKLSSARHSTPSPNTQLQPASRELFHSIRLHTYTHTHTHTHTQRISEFHKARALRIDPFKIENEETSSRALHVSGGMLSIPSLTPVTRDSIRLFARAEREKWRLMAFLLRQQWRESAGI